MLSKRSINWLSRFTSNDTQKPQLHYIFIQEIELQDGKLSRWLIATDGFVMGMLPCDDSIPDGWYTVKDGTLISASYAGNVPNAKSIVELSVRGGAIYPVARYMYTASDFVQLVPYDGTIKTLLVPAHYHNKIIGGCTKFSVKIESWRKPVLYTVQLGKYDAMALLMPVHYT